ncbi:zinc finger protein ZFP2-like isoform X2 [Ptychodera flava]|uniref:zinc finger protein ZFP2-like isoform X2 n=1 Tax=Ptychodera flava TaxID=63121 RepID=UPI00396A11EE
MEATQSDDVTDREGCGGQLQTKRRISQGRECCAPGCSNMQLDKEGNTTGIHFFRFPQDESRRTLWCEKIKLSDKVDEITANSVLCELHFKKDDIRRTPYGANRYSLKKDAFPQATSEPIVTTRRGRKLSKPQRYQEYQELEESTDESPPKKGRPAEKERSSALYVEPHQPQLSNKKQEQAELTPPSSGVQQVAGDLTMNKLQLQSEWLEKMNQLRKQGLFCDVHMEINGRAIRAHRVVLSACSALFHQQLATGGAILPPEDSYSLDFVQAFEMVIEFAYTAQVDLSMNNVQSIMQIAFHYQILPLVDECYSYLKWHREHKLTHRPVVLSNGYDFGEASEDWTRRNGLHQSTLAAVYDGDDSNEGNSSQSSLNSSLNGGEAADTENSQIQNGLTEKHTVSEGKTSTEVPRNHCTEAGSSDVSDSTQLRKLLISKTLTLENQCGDTAGNKSRSVAIPNSYIDDDINRLSWSFNSFVRDGKKAFRERTETADEGMEQHTLFLCVDCGKSFNTKIKLISHSKLHSKEPLKCKYCAEVFMWKQSLDHHMITQHYDVLDTQEILAVGSMSPSNTEPGSLGDAEPLETEGREKERVHFCGVCGRGFSERYRLMRHEKIHTGEKPFKCDQCDKVFSRKDNLDRHFFVQHLIRDREMKADVSNDKGSVDKNHELETSKEANHEGDVSVGNAKGAQNFLTDIEVKKENNFDNDVKDSYISALMGQMTPRLSKQHVCLVCGKSFTNKYRLVRHEVIHTGERPYKCEICHRKFTRKDHMERHKSRQHPNGELGTPSKKGRKPKVAPNQEDELETVTGLPDFQCQLCGMVFQNKTGLNLHKKCHEFVDCKDCKTIFLNEEDYRSHSCTGDSLLREQADVPSLYPMDVPT